MEQVFNFILTLVDVSLLGLSLYIMYGTDLICGDEKVDLDKTTAPYASLVSVSNTLLISSATSLVAIFVRAIKPCARAFIVWCEGYGDRFDEGNCCLCCTYTLAIILGAVTAFCALVHFHNNSCSI